MISFGILPTTAQTFVITIISSQGKLNCLMALPSITSEMTFEYMFAVSKVCIPASYLSISAFRRDFKCALIGTDDWPLAFGRLLILFSRNMDSVFSSYYFIKPKTTQKNNSIHTIQYTTQHYTNSAKRILLIIRYVLCVLCVLYVLCCLCCVMLLIGRK